MSTEQLALRAYVLIEVEVGKLADFRRSLEGFTHPAARVLTADTLTGPYDALLLLELDDYDQLGICLTEGVHVLAGVRRTTTCIALRHP